LEGPATYAEPLHNPSDLDVAEILSAGGLESRGAVVREVNRKDTIRSAAEYWRTADQTPIATLAIMPIVVRQITRRTDTPMWVPI